MKNIAAIGLAINVPNKALEMLQNAKDHMLSRPHTVCKTVFLYDSFCEVFCLRIIDLAL